MINGATLSPDDGTPTDTMGFVGFADDVRPSYCTTLLGFDAVLVDFGVIEHL